MICVHFINGTASTRTRSYTASTVQTQARLERKWYVCILSIVQLLHALGVVRLQPDKHRLVQRENYIGTYYQQFSFHAVGVIRLQPDEHKFVYRENSMCTFHQQYSFSTQQVVYNVNRTNTGSSREKLICVHFIISIVGVVQLEADKHMLLLVYRENGMCTFHQQNSFSTQQEVYNFNRTNRGSSREKLICIHFIISIVGVVRLQADKQMLVYKLVFVNKNVTFYRFQGHKCFISTVS